jgi:hypothetical protein
VSTVDAAEPAVRAWAIVAYLCGDNPQLAAHIRNQVAAILAFQGSDHFHLAVQWDLPGDAGGRAVLNGVGAPEQQPIGRVNTGDPAAFLDFLRWAFDRCPAQHLILIVSGTGLLDARASIGGPETDRTHLFTICDDATAGDALSLSEIGPMLRQAVEMSSRDRIDILALDLRELQCLEVAYELEGIVDVLIAPQTRVPDSGWNFEVVLKQLDAVLGGADPAAPVSVPEVARLLVRTVGAAYEANRHGHLSLSALNLQTLKNFASAFDTLSLAMVHSVGEDLVWEARAAVARKLKPPGGRRDASGAVEGPADAAELSVEAEYLYDLLELLAELRVELDAHGRSGLLRLALDQFDTLDIIAFKRALESIDAACFTSGGRLRFPALRQSISDPRGARRRLREARELAAGPAGTWADAAPRRRAGLAALFTDAELRAPERHSWLDGWPEAAIAELRDPLRATYRAAARQQQRLTHLTAMTDRVLNLLRTGSAGVAGQPSIAPLVLEHFVTASESPRHGGVSLYRPRNLDQLIASDYLKLRFNQKIHWTVLLAVINLIGNHPRALWRILSALLATADNNTRAQLIDRITGPGSVIAPFREQFVVLAPVRAYVLSLEPDPSADPRPLAGGGAAPRRTDAYRVRLELADREAFISEFRSVVDPDALQGVIDGLVAMLEAAEPLSSADTKRIESLGGTLGEDILQELGVKLTEANRARDQIHLQLQIPRELMKYPWELMHYKGGWLSEHFAMGRQVFSRMGGGVVRARVPGPLRALVIGNPPTRERTLPYAAQEAEQIARSFAALAAETDGLLDFDRERDTRINQEVTREQLRELLRHGNYDIIHFAGHAAFDPEHPASSAWLLSDGRLSAQAIRNTLRWLDTQPWLVYANACEAGMDHGTPAIYQSDVFGLASAFLDHGVSVFVGPLWRIDDRVAARIAQVFYEQLLKERQTVGEALRIAKADAKRTTFDAAMRQADGGRSAERVAMVSWAGLVLYGNSTATFGQRVGAPPPPEPRTPPAS